MCCSRGLEGVGGRDFIVDVPGEFGEIGGSGSILAGTFSMLVQKMCKNIPE